MIETVNHPEHYNVYSNECIDEMIAVFGKEVVIDFCKCNVWKYRYRMNSKNDYQDDMKKANWYMNKLVELQSGGDSNA